MFLQNMMGKVLHVLGNTSWGSESSTSVVGQIRGPSNIFTGIGGPLTPTRYAPLEVISGLTLALFDFKRLLHVVQAGIYPAY